MVQLDDREQLRVLLEELGADHLLDGGHRLDAARAHAHQEVDVSRVPLLLSEDRL